MPLLKGYLDFFPPHVEGALVHSFNLGKHSRPVLKPFFKSKIAKVAPKRGIPAGAAKDAAMIAQEDMRSEETHFTHKMLAVTSLMNAISTEIASTVTLLQTFEEGSFMHQEALNDYKTLTMNLTKFKTQLEELSSMERQVPEAVETFLRTSQTKRPKQSSTTLVEETPTKNIQF